MSGRSSGGWRPGSELLGGGEKEGRTAGATGRRRTPAVSCAAGSRQERTGCGHNGQQAMCEPPPSKRETGSGMAATVTIARIPRGEEAAALCRVNRAQVNRRASGVSCTAWLGGTISIRFQCWFLLDQTRIAAFYELCPNPLLPVYTHC